MSENELLQKWATTKKQQYLNLLLTQLYRLGKEKLSDQVSRDVLHNAILKIHQRLETKCDIREIKSFFLKTLYNGTIDYYKHKKQHDYLPFEDTTEIEQQVDFGYERIDLDQLLKLEHLVRNKSLKKSRLKFLHAILLSPEANTISRQNKFFHRNELKKSVSLLDVQQAGQFFTYTRRILQEVEDNQQSCEVQKLYEDAKSYKRRALAYCQQDSIQDYNETELDLLKLFNITIALHLYRKATSLNPNYFKSRFNMGFCYYKLGKYDNAIKEFEVSLYYLNKDKQQSNFKVKQGSTLRNLGTIYLFHVNQYHKALERFQEALAFTPDDEKIRLGIIFSACKLNDLQVANEQIKLCKPKILSKNIEDWSNQDEKVKALTINLYKENQSLRSYIPIEKII